MVGPLFLFQVLILNHHLQKRRVSLVILIHSTGLVRIKMSRGVPRLVYNHTTLMDPRAVRTSQWEEVVQVFKIIDQVVTCLIIEEEVF